MEELRPSQLITIINELQKQIELEQATEQLNKWAFLASVIVNGFNRMAGAMTGAKRGSKIIKPEDFLGLRAKQILKGLGSEAKDEPNWEKHIKDAQDKGLDGPWEGGEE